MKTPIKIILPLLLLCSVAKAQVGINTLNPDTSAILHIYSGEKGVLLPNVPENIRNASRVSPSTADGLLVYDPVDKIYYFFNRDTKRWMALNVFQAQEDTNVIEKSDVRLSNEFKNKNVYIGSNPNQKAEAKLHVDGNIVIKDSINVKTVKTSGNIITSSGQFIGKGVVPVGTVLMYTGDLNKFDGTGKGKTGTDMDGWALCNNNNGTPDLRGRFIVGYNPVDADYNALGLKGGETNHRLSTEELAPHFHYFRGSYFGDGAISDPNKWHPQITNVSYHESYMTEDSGGENGVAKPHENRPPYYVLAYIMRIN